MVGNNNHLCYNNKRGNSYQFTTKETIMIDANELSYWKAEFPSLTEEEITEILEAELELLWKPSN